MWHKVRPLLAKWGLSGLALVCMSCSGSNADVALCQQALEGAVAAEDALDITGISGSQTAEYGGKREIGGTLSATDRTLGAIEIDYVCLIDGSNVVDIAPTDVRAAP